MLQTPAIKHDPAAATQAAKDKDPTSGPAAGSGSASLETQFSSYFSQLMASLPAQQASGTGLPAPAPAPAPRQADPAKKPAQTSGQGVEATSKAADASQAAGLAAAAAVSAPAPAPAAPAAKAKDAQAATDSAAQAGGAAQAPAAPGPADPKPAANQAGTAQPGNPAAAAAPQAAVPAGVPQEVQDQAKALAQAFPGTKLQVQQAQQVGDQASDAIQGSAGKQPLTEFLGQNPMDSTASPQDATLQVQGTAQNLAQALGQASGPAVPAAAAGLAGMQAVAGLQSPLLAGASQPAQGQVAAVQNAASGTTLAGNVASSQLGAAALPGASGAVRVTASSAAQGALPSAQEDVLSQVDGSIRWLVKNQDKSAELQLHPESLGRVQVKLTVEGNVVHAKVWASEPAAVPLLQDHKNYLEQSLKQQGLNLGSFDLQQGRRQDQAPLPSSPEPSMAVSGVASAGLAGQESPVAAVAAAAHAGRIEFVA